MMMTDTFTPPTAALNILFATPECAPWVKTGGLGDVCGALPKALGELGHRVRVLIPAYGGLMDLREDAERAWDIPATGPWPAARLLLVHAQGLDLLMLDCAALYDRPAGPYMDTAGQDYADNARRFGFFSHVAAQLASDHSPMADWRVDILHGHDWTAAMAPAYLAQLDSRHRAATVLTIHNMLFQGLFPGHVSMHIDIGPKWFAEDPALLHWGRLCFLKAGLHHADILSTVSPGYAKEILTPPASCGMEDILQARADDLHGILNGVDTQVWNPATDPLITARYSADSLELKAHNKAVLRQIFGLRPDAPRAGKDGNMLLGMVGRLTSQKGVDLILECLPDMLNMGCQLCVLGTGDKQLESAMLQAAQTFPGQVDVRIGFDEALAHLIEAGSDAFLMPSTFEPCGLNQMYSQLYGTPPIVHATGGLADTVHDDNATPQDSAQPRRRTGTGFSFSTPTSTALVQTIARARQTFGQPSHWQDIQRNGMALDHSWRARALLHVHSYVAAMKKREAHRAHHAIGSSL